MTMTLKHHALVVENVLQWASVLLEEPYRMLWYGLSQKLALVNDDNWPERKMLRSWARFELELVNEEEVIAEILRVVELDGKVTCKH